MKIIFYIANLLDYISLYNKLKKIKIDNNFSYK